MTKPDFTPDAHSMKMKISRLEVQLAKANERVKELERESMAFRSILDQPIKHPAGTDKMYSLGFNHAMRLFEDIYLGVTQKALNKFAAEKKVEGAYAVISLLDETKDSKAILMANKYVREQLRKEQENV